MAVKRAVPAERGVLAKADESADPAGRKNTSATDVDTEAKQEVDRQLDRYRSMRDFGVTAEPDGSNAAALDLKPAALRRGKSEGLPFVIQKHQATRLHYDFRLGWRGVLKSWACAKGPSYATSDKRLAVQVEDHPIEYGGFEGTIPRGQYGGGTVLIWDQGTWEPEVDVDHGLEHGSLKFTMHGTKLRGRWALVRMGGRAANEAKPNWLLIKEHDGQERPADAVPITESEPDSVVTGRSLAEVAAAADHVWQSHAVAPPVAKRGAARLKEKLLTQRTEVPGGSALKAPKERKDQDTASGRDGRKNQDVVKGRAAQSAPTLSTRKAWLDGAPNEAMPEFISPQLAVPSQLVPAGTGWLYELKLDGYRVQAHLQQRKAHTKKLVGPAVKLLTRSGLDWTARMPAVAKALAGLPVEQAVLDGELVVLNAEGICDFGALQDAFEQGGSSDASQTMTLCLFDLLHLNGKKTRALPLRVRRELLTELVREKPLPGVVLSEALASDGVDAAGLLTQACASGAEGLVCKRADAAYVSGRGDAWQKIKCLNRQEFVIAGYTLPSDGGAGMGALLLGFYEQARLVYCGRCGTGWDRKTGEALRKELGAIGRAGSPVDEGLSGLAARGVKWVKPQLCCEVQFAAMTRDRKLRHASFQGLRRDKPAREVVMERKATPAAGAVEEPEAQGAAIAKAGAGSPPVLVRQEATHETPAGKSSASKTSVRKSATAQAPLRKGAALAGPALTHPDKVIDAESGVTKRQLAEYFSVVAEVMLPHLVDRPASLVRCPGGVGKPCFFQKHAGKGMPGAIGSIAVADKDAPETTEPYLVIDSEASLLAVAQLGGLEIHPWGSREPELEKPDRLIFDLDPDEPLAWEDVAAGATTVRDLLQEMGLESFVKSTGGKGLHVVVALEPAVDWVQLRLFARGVAAAIESTDPKRYLIKMSKAARKGRIFIDWMRNERGATAIAPWSPRARAGMRVAMPLEWSELGEGLPQFSVANLNEWRERVKTAGSKAKGKAMVDPWAAMKPQRIRPSVLEAVLQAAQALEGTPKKSRR